jgi:uncharacterized protein YkwD
MRRFATAALGVVVLCAVVAGGAGAWGGSGARTWVNDFERYGDDTSAHDWWTDAPATSQRTPSGASATYASGIASAHGHWHVRMRPNMLCPKTPAGPACFGSYTYFGKNGDSTNPVFPQGGYVTQIDVYLDVPWMAADPVDRFDTRFDWDSAIDNADGSFRRDFVFNAGTPLTPTETTTSPGFYVNASTNGGRSGAFPENPCPNPATPPNTCRSPVKITTSGWYTFRHFFHYVTISGVDYLAVDMSILRNGTTVASWTIYDQKDATCCGGDAYGWFVINEIQDLAADCVAIHPPSTSSPHLGSACAFQRAHEGENCERNEHSDKAEHDEYDRINRERAAHGQRPVSWNDHSSDAARKHACDRFQHGDDGEHGSDGSSSGDRLHAEGVIFLVNAENNGWSAGDVADDALAALQTDLLGDPLAEANVLNPAFSQVGVGAVYQDGELYLTEDFTG